MRTDALPLSWQRLTEQEPRLVALEAEIQQDPLRGRVRDHRFWPAWECYKRRLATVVGWRAEREELRSSDAFDLAYQHLLSCFERR